MSSNKFQKIANNIIKKDKELFDSLKEFESIGKTNTKTRLNFTIDRSIARRFRDYCQKKGYNMSLKIEKAMEKIIN